MNDREEYWLKRRRKKLTHKEIAKAISCSQSLISRYETGDCEMGKEKVEQYKKYIDSM
ncbi:helix-turn-helix transcriptional regulator [Oceanobacillus sp. J11TS1]|uniref:helix-turn-helix domain-containing protein n=1 Tax=Oceanobacillus sp. J11TS1 TaxID=2807191 RepID=UPI001B173749|nr:helix-turn-helix transcriptional regulator [Oceanobacillus sp. J11TS1]GIO22485.1 hypothetical protein J11TS1_10660 [Oceanobacillus sp. J11TS1]